VYSIMFAVKVPTRTETSSTAVRATCVCVLGFSNILVEFP